MQEQRFLLITGFLVALIGAPAVYSIVRDPQQMLKANDSISERAPASAEASEAPTKNEIKSKSVVLNYDCSGKNNVFEVEGTLLRLQGNSCIDEKWKDVSIINQTNGFTASVIFLKNKKFTTDFIDLKEGDNKLSIQAVNEKGQSIHREFLVKRRFPAAVTESDN